MVVYRHCALLLPTQPDFDSSLPPTRRRDFAFEELCRKAEQTLPSKVTRVVVVV